MLGRFGIGAQLWIGERGIYYYIVVHTHGNRTGHPGVQPVLDISLSHDDTPLPYTLEDDDEPDDTFLEPAPNEKGLKTEKITTLKQDGGIVNYKVWCNELKTVFNTD